MLERLFIMSSTQCGKDRMTCANCWLFVAIECDKHKSKYGICNEDNEQVLAENPACDRGKAITKLE